MTQFTIDENGVITDIKTRAAHPHFEEEAIRVIKLLPKFIPGKQRSENVSVVYTLPITIMIED